MLFRSMNIIEVDLIVVLIFYSFNNVLSVLEFIKYLCEWIGLLSDYHNRTEYKFMSQLKVDMLLKDLAIWLGKCVGVTLTRTAKIEEYAACALAKTAHSSTSRLGKCLHKMAWTKDRLDRQKQWLICRVI